MSLTGLQVARRRRRIRATIVLVLAAVLVAAGLAYAVHNLNPPNPVAGGPSTPVCTPTALPQAASVLNIYNASGPSGDARSTASKFAAGGFKVGTVSNDPYKQKVPGVAQIRYGPSGKSFAEKYVVNLVPGATLMPDGRTDSSVDVVIGKQFRVNVPKAAPTKTC